MNGIGAWTDGKGRQLWLVLAFVLGFAASARAQDTADERRCTGQWRATVEERIASCTALIDSGRYEKEAAKLRAAQSRVDQIVMGSEGAPNLEKLSLD